MMGWRVSRIWRQETTRVDSSTGRANCRNVVLMSQEYFQGLASRLVDMFIPVFRWWYAKVVLPRLDISLP